MGLKDSYASLPLIMIFPVAFAGLYNLPHIAATNALLPDPGGPTTANIFLHGHVCGSWGSCSTSHERCVSFWFLGKPHQAVMQCCQHDMTPHTSCMRLQHSNLCNLPGLRISADFLQKQFSLLCPLVLCGLQSSNHRSSCLNMCQGLLRRVPMGRSSPLTNLSTLW